MAGLIGLQASDLEIQDALGARRFDYEDWIPHPVVRLTTNVPVAVERDGQRVVVPARWGFPIGAGRPIGNARDDRLTASPMWSSLLGKSHGLVAATAVYEQKEWRGKKTSFWFRRVDGKAIVMPALVGLRTVKDEKRLCAAIVTTAPSQFFGQFHDRQVCALDEPSREAWMTATTAADALKCLKPAANKEWEAVPVDDVIFKPGRREAEHLIPVADPIRWQD